jgi:hypothetical protein
MLPPWAFCAQLRFQFLASQTHPWHTQCHAKLFLATPYASLCAIGGISGTGNAVARHAERRRQWKYEVKIDDCAVLCMPEDTCWKGSLGRERHPCRGRDERESRLLPGVCGEGLRGGEADSIAVARRRGAKARPQGQAQAHGSSVRPVDNNKGPWQPIWPPGALAFLGKPSREGGSASFSTCLRREHRPPVPCRLRAVRRSEPRS